MSHPLKIGLAWLCIGLAMPVPAAANDVCMAVQAGEFGGAASSPASAPAATAAADGKPPRRPELNLARAGRYCLGQDLRQHKLLDPRTGREMKTLGGDAIVLIGADDVSLDLASHAVSNERELGYTLVRHHRYEPGRGHFHAFVRTGIRNGRLFSPGPRGVGIRLVSSRAYDTRGFGAPVRIPEGSTAADVYRDTRHVLEDLLIEAGSRAILLDGRNNIVRNNRIVVDGATAIVAQGPGVVIENNLIEVRGRPGAGQATEPAAGMADELVIRLIQADGAVVRNNQVRLVGSSRKDPLPAAVGLVASRDVLVADNSILGMQAVVAADAVSDYREARNRLQRCAAEARRFLPPDEAGDTAVAREPSCRPRLLGPVSR